MAMEEVAEQGLRSYNYPDFAAHLGSDGGEAFASFSDRLHPGERAPDFAVTRLDDGAAMMVSEWWRRSPLVMEFGSFS